MIVGVIMIVLFIVLLWHTLEGNRNIWLLQVTSMLLVSNVGAVIIGYTLYATTILELEETGYFIAFGIGNALYFACFGVSHYLLAVKYRNMSKNVPEVIEGKIPGLESGASKMTTKMMISLNIVVPLIFGAFKFSSKLRVAENRDEHLVTDGFIISYNIVLLITLLLQVYSGLILVVSVVRIHRFFVRINARDFINTAMLLRHATAFVLYTISNFLYGCACGYWVFSHGTDGYHYVASSGLFLNISSLISQVLLLLIFWDLGTTVKKRPESR